ncbi:MAG: fused MFS/spermidine synthase [Prolixibacteraceae bacterium]
MSNSRKTFIFACIVFISGIAGLSYELLWIRSIKGFFGSELFSISMVFTLYFAGLGIGGFVGNKIISRKYDPIKIYSSIELLIGLFGLAFPFLIQATQNSYLGLTGIVPEHLWLLMKALHITILLIVPTTLIGMTLPLITAIIVDKPEAFTTRFSLFYGINTLGAVLGSIVVGMFLIPKLGIVWSGRLIVLGNFVVAFLCFLYRNEFSLKQIDLVYKKQKWNETLVPSLIAFFMGFLALTYEVVWFRIFNFYFLSTTVSLALLLSIFLIGLALGSLLLSLWKRPINVKQLGFLELAKAVMMVLSFLIIRKIFFQNWAELSTSIGTENVYHKVLGLYGVFGFFAFMLPAIVMGMTFPLIERIWPSSKAGTSHVVGVITAWNTWGGALGALLAGLFLISYIGSSNTLILVVFISATLSIVLFLLAKKPLLTLIPLLLAVLVVTLLPKEMNWKRNGNTDSYTYYEEGKMCSVSINKNVFGDLTLNLDNGYVLGGTGAMAIVVQDHQGALPIIINSNPSKRVLKIGEGTGITSNAVVESYDVAHLDIVEIVPEVVETLPYFAYYNDSLTNNSRVSIHKGDGREFLAMSEEKYDVIIGELYSPQIAGTGNLYSIEHFENVKAHLAANGTFCQWLQMAQFSEETFAIVVNTFLQVFPDASLWLANNNKDQLALGLVATNPENWNPSQINQALSFFSDDFKRTTGWQLPYDIVVSFVTNDFSEIVKQEKRINTIDYPVIEEIAARTFNQMVSFDVLAKARKWPQEWSKWSEGHSVWNKYWDLIDSYIVWNLDPKNSQANQKLKLNMDNLPNLPVLNIYKADMLVSVVETNTSDPNYFKSDTDQARFMATLYKNAIAIDSNNWIYYFNLSNAYHLLNDEENLNATLIDLWHLMPEPLKSEPIYMQLMQ